MTSDPCNQYCADGMQRPFVANPAPPVEAPIDSYEIIAYAQAQRHRAEMLLRGTYSEEEFDKLTELARWQNYYTHTKEGTIPEK